MYYFYKMKKQSVILLSIFSMLQFSCSGDAENNSEQNQEKEIIVANPFAGEWQLDSSAFITNNTRSVTPPVMPTTWFFGESGAYKVINTFKLEGSYSYSDDSLFVILMEVPNDYEIISLTDKKLHLHSIVLESDSSSIYSEAYLTRLN